jgi:type II secretory pathway pseudopilin PulG
LECFIFAKKFRSFHLAQLGLFFDPRPSYINMERFFSIVETIIAAIMFGVIFGIIIALVKSTVKTQASKWEQHAKMIESYTKKYMATKAFPPPLQDEVLRHQRFAASSMVGEEQLAAFNGLPLTLAQDINDCNFYS